MTWSHPSRPCGGPDVAPIPSVARAPRARAARARLIVLAASVLLLAGSGRAHQLPPVPVPGANPITEAKRVLGKALFWDEQLSSDDTTACGTCHMPRAGGSDLRTPASPNQPGPDGLIGTDDDGFGSPGVLRQDAAGAYAPDPVFGFTEQVTPRFSPSVFMSAYSPELFWDGRSDGTFTDPLTGQVLISSGGALETQSLEPLLSEVEMAREGRTLADVTAKLERVVPLALASDLNPDLQTALAGEARYPDLFEAAFGDPAITPARIAFALATYQRTLVPDGAKFDRVMAGEDFFTGVELAGFIAWDAAGVRCAECHPEPLFTDNAYHNLGLRPIAEDSGREAVTGDPADRGRFKTPSLRNVGLRPAVFHTGAPGIDDLEDVLEFYHDDGGPFAENKDPLLTNLAVPLNLRESLLQFLGTLTDPRLLAEEPPFDRPRLHSEATDPPVAAYGHGTPGSGGATPAMLAGMPPHAGAGAGNPDYKLGLAGGLGGAPAFFVVGLAPAAPGTTIQGAAVHVSPVAPIVVPLTLEGVGSGQGHATLPLPIPPGMALGVPFHVQWFVADAGAPGGLMAASEAARIELF